MTPEITETLAWAEIEARMALLRYTGPTLVQWAEGKIQELQIPGPATRIRLTKPSRRTQT